MNTQVLLAPMSGFSDLAFRLISRECGAKFCYLEMLSANTLMYNSPGNRHLMTTIDKDTPLAAQLVGSDPSIIFDAALKVLDRVPIDYIELNSACPVKKVIKKKGGAYLLHDTGLLEKILLKMCKSLPVPVTVKLRIGFRKIDPKETARIAKICEAAGVARIFMHGRTASQHYMGDVDYASLRAAKEAVKVPFFASGNILSPVLAKKMVDQTGCDGILVARGALGNPWIFSEIEDYLTCGVLPEKKRALSEKKKMLKRHLSYIERYKETGPANLRGFMGKVTMWYLKGIPDAAKLRNRICKTKSIPELYRLIYSVA